MIRCRRCFGRYESYEIHKHGMCYNCTRGYSVIADKMDITVSEEERQRREEKVIDFDIYHARVSVRKHFNKG